MIKIGLSRCGGIWGIHLLLFLCSLLTASSARATDAVNQLVPYPVTEGMPRDGVFTVKVRTPGKEWQEIPAYLVKVSQGVSTLAPTKTSGVNMSPQDSSMTSFGFSGVVDVSITCNKGNIESARIRPLSYGIASVITKNTIMFSLAQPRNLSVEVNGDIFHNLQLFANPVEATRPSPDDPNVIYYGPGLHQVGRVNVPSGKTVYLAAGALVEGSLLVSKAENVRILGRGILYQSAKPMNITLSPGELSSRHDAVLIEFSKDVEVDGIIVVPASYTVLVGQSQGVTIRNIKSFSARGNNDGIDVFSSSDVMIDGVFMRNSDDTIAIYGHRWGYYGDTRRVTVQNSTLWADVAHPILVGTHGDSTSPEMLQDLKFLNIDILDQREPQLDYQGCMSLNAGDSNLIRNVLFENIRVEDFREGQLMNLRVFYNRKYNTSPGRGIEEVLFKDITYNGTRANPSMIAGFDDTHEVRNIIFENLRINGRLISDDMPGKPGYYKTADMANIFVGEHVEGIQFRVSSDSKPATAIR
jgi:hypothetical protein